MTRDDVFRPICWDCGKPLGDFSFEEFEAYFYGGHSGQLCFDCGVLPEPIFCYPAAVGRVGDVKIEEGVEFWVSRSADGLLRWRSQSHAHDACTRALSLSSSTYLNISPKQDNQETVIFSENEICPSCLIGKLIVNKDGAICEKCDYWRGIFDSLPAVEGLLSHCLLIVSCPDCEKVRILRETEVNPTGSVFCLYHHALLIEQHEDGSLGWDHA